jgi:hypothetical protein
MIWKMTENAIGMEFTQTGHPAGWPILRFFLDIGKSEIL